ncbi:MAG TPA: nucleotide pyrophosphatase [Chromatiaceae bacterium]|nr:nucleotide pyrophosphatase [Chromatiaceae bacterium]
MVRKVVVVGLDSAPPRLLYDELLGELEVLGELVGGGRRYTLVSTHPPITIPAWASMVTGKTPGELGLYGFRHRRPGDVGESYIVSSKMLKAPAVWDVVGKKGLRSVVVGVPPSYPPKPVRGVMITDFVTPGPEKPYTWPPALKREVERLVGAYVFDVVYRSEDKDRIIKELWNMTRQHFRVLRYLASSFKWDFMMFVEIGVDRVHHAFWKYYDPQHPRHAAGSKYADVIHAYYSLLDSELRELLRLIPKDAIVVVASDHGAKAMKGAFAINQWLEEQGYLKLRRKPEKPCTELTPDIIDWEGTVAWGWGGYYARIFINLKGREPYGAVEPREYEAVIEELRRDLLQVRGPRGEAWSTKVYTPRELYPEVRGDAPDLLVYLDNLNWRAAGTLGWESPYLEENDRGPDDAVHDWYGVFAVYDPEGTLGTGDAGTVRAEEVAGLLLRLMGS